MISCCNPNQDTILEKGGRLLPTEDCQETEDGEGFSGTLVCALWGWAGGAAGGLS